MQWHLQAAQSFFNVGLSNPTGEFQLSSVLVGPLWRVTKLYESNLRDIENCCVFSEQAPYDFFL